MVIRRASALSKFFSDRCAALSTPIFNSLIDASFHRLERYLLSYTCAFNYTITKLSVVTAMNNGYPSVSIEDIARLAGETCVYRGASQGAKAPSAATQRESATLPSRLLKLLTRQRR